MIWFLRPGRQQREHVPTGAYGEQLAREYLEGQGLKFLAANWFCKLGEIDLIMDAPDGTRVFVEVRTRAVTMYGAAAETVEREKQRKLIKTAQLYQQREQYWGPARFDVVAIELQGTGAPVIEHIPHAFGV